MIWIYRSSIPVISLNANVVIVVSCPDWIENCGGKVPKWIIDEKTLPGQHRHLLWVFSAIKQPAASIGACIKTYRVAVALMRIDAQPWIHRNLIVCYMPDESRLWHAALTRSAQIIIYASIRAFFGRTYDSVKNCSTTNSNKTRRAQCRCENWYPSQPINCSAEKMWRPCVCVCRCPSSLSMSN